MGQTPTSFGPMRTVALMGLGASAIAVVTCVVALSAHRGSVAVGALIVLLTSISVVLVADSESGRAG